ncbi:MAG TPA: hypothetical protein VGO64_08475, partial [Candidatus Limnocylindrales bacterium]|nr:hypothetical protein [Candidatus Limnocylindrales bacterium]
MRTIVVGRVVRVDGSIVRTTTSFDKRGARTAVPIALRLRGLTRRRSVGGGRAADGAGRPDNNRQPSTRSITV